LNSPAASSAWLLERTFPKIYGQRRYKIAKLEQMLDELAARIDSLVPHDHRPPDPEPFAIGPAMGIDATGAAN
jgi:hypothetical protein